MMADMGNFINFLFVDTLPAFIVAEPIVYLMSFIALGFTIKLVLSLLKF